MYRRLDGTLRHATEKRNAGSAEPNGIITEILCLGSTIRTRSLINGRVIAPT
jgi:hypothetical protein